jgi:uncharacterized protein YjeT (DUF2065 family)
VTSYHASNANVAGILAVVAMNYIDVLIPGIIGVLLLMSPRLFTKAQGEKLEQVKGKLRTIGFVLIGVAILYLIVKLLGRT